MIIFPVISQSHDQIFSIKSSFYDDYFERYDSYSFLSGFLMELRFLLQLVSSPFSVFRSSTRGRSASWAQDKNAAAYRHLNSLQNKTNLKHSALRIPRKNDFRKTHNCFPRHSRPVFESYEAVQPTGDDPGRAEPCQIYAE